MAATLNTRAVAAKTVWQIIDHGQSLDNAISGYLDKNRYHSTQDKSFIQELSYGVCRWYGELDTVANQLLRSPFRKKDRVVHFILLVGLYQLRHLRTAEHAAVAETVSACKQLNKQWAKNVINGCLRNYLRNPVEQYSDRHKQTHPNWVIRQVENAWPDYSDDIFRANDQRPPMCLRVNRMQFSRQDYLAELSNANIEARADAYSEDGILLTQPYPVTKLPGFETGSCSVQDTAAQFAAHFINAKTDMTVLDACAAPGGKTAHILERANNRLEMHAVDISERRTEQLHSTLNRLDVDAQIITADASKPVNWQTPTGGYDRILVDAPCSGLGVIRRHPDIKHHRRPSDITALNSTQQALLVNLWKTLAPDGRLLYMTCSILPSENEEQIRQFVDSQNDAMLVEIDHPNAIKLEFGVQTLPGVHDMDGFYYCLLEKHTPENC